MSAIDVHRRHRAGHRPRPRIADRGGRDRFPATPRSARTARSRFDRHRRSVARVRAPLRRQRLRPARRTAADADASRGSSHAIAGTRKRRRDPARAGALVTARTTALGRLATRSPRAAFAVSNALAALLATVSRRIPARAANALSGSFAARHAPHSRAHLEDAMRDAAPSVLDPRCRLRRRCARSCARMKRSAVFVRR